MHFFTFYRCVLLLIQEMDGGKGPVGLHDVDIIHIGSVTKGDALLCEAVIDLILHLVDDDDAVSRYAAFDFKKERMLDQIIRKTADQLRFREEPLLRRLSGKGCVRCLVILTHESIKRAAQLIKGMKIPHVKGRHPMILHRTEPAFDLGLLCWRVRMAIADGRADPCGKKFHLTVLIGRSVIEIEPDRSSVLGDGGLHDGHQVDKCIVEENVGTGNESAGIIKERDDIDTMFLPISGRKVRADGRIPAPDLIDMRAFIASHVLVVGKTFTEHHLVDEAEDRRLRELAVPDRAFIPELPVDGRSQRRKDGDRCA